MKKSRSSLYAWLISALIFVTPSNLFLKLTERGAYVNGLFVDYLVPKLFLTDTIIILLLVVWVGERQPWRAVGKRWREIKSFSKAHLQLVTVTAVILATFIWRQGLSERPFIAWAQLLHLFELIGVAGVILSQRELLIKSRLIHWTILVAIGFQSLLGFYQFSTHHSLAPYYLLGESQIDRSIGISQLEFGGVIQTAAYGTTSHPNILGGFLAIYILLAWQIFRPQLKSSHARLALILTTILGVAALGLTGSVSAWLALIMGTLLVFGSAKWHSISSWLGLVFLAITPLLLRFLQAGLKLESLSIDRRILLNTAATRMWLNHPVFGVGLQNFTVHLEKYADSIEIIRFLQPVHHVGWLWLSETGILGLLLLGLLFLWIRLLQPKISYQTLGYWLVPLVPILVLDHYLLTSHTGWLILVWWIAFRFVTARNFN